MDRFDRPRPRDGRLAPLAEALAQAVAERALEIVVAALDMNALLDQVDMNRVLGQVDIERVLDRIDLDGLVGRMDLNSIVQRIDVDALVEQTDLGAVIARSSSGVASDALDLVRSQAVGLDEFIARWVERLRRRRYSSPPGLASRAGAGPHAEDAASPETPMVIRKTLLGKCAGFASRFAAFAVDVGASIGVFMLALAAISFAAKVLTGRDIAWHRGDLWVVIAFAAWEFVYFAYCWAVSGRTVGMALFGVQVVGDDGSDASGRRAVIRTLALPLSFLLLGLGFVGILVGARRRALHDVIAGTAIIYSWDARAARLRFLSRG